MKAASASEAKELSDLTAKGKGPCSVPLQTDKNLEKQHFGTTHTPREGGGKKEKIKNNLVVKTRGGMEQ